MSTVAASDGGNVAAKARAETHFGRWNYHKASQARKLKRPRFIARAYLLGIRLVIGKVYFKNPNSNSGTPPLVNHDARCRLFIPN
jgi:hypothetical protein